MWRELSKGRQLVCGVNWLGGLNWLGGAVRGLSCKAYCYATAKVQSKAHGLTSKEIVVAIRCGAGSLNLLAWKIVWSYQLLFSNLFSVSRQLDALFYGTFLIQFEDLSICWTGTICSSFSLKIKLISHHVVSVKVGKEVTAITLPLLLYHYNLG